MQKFFCFHRHLTWVHLAGLEMEEKVYLKLWVKLGKCTGSQIGQGSETSPCLPPGNGLEPNYGGEMQSLRLSCSRPGATAHCSTPEKERGAPFRGVGVGGGGGGCRKFFGLTNNWAKPTRESF